MLRFWTNPEFIRHRRAELRFTRAVTVLAVVGVICVLIYLSCWGSRLNDLEVERARAMRWGTVTTEQLMDFEQQSPVIVAQNFYRSVMIGLLGVLSFWSLLSCAQSISGERERKTWDFQRTTRLKPGELLIGKLLGEPIMAYFIVLCCFPVVLAAGVYGEMRLSYVLAAYALILAAGVFVGLAGLWLSSLFDSKSRGVGLIGTFGLYVGLALMVGLAGSDFPGLASVSCLVALLPLIGIPIGERLPATLFGFEIPWTVMTLLLYFIFGALLVMMLVRNLKKDYGEARQLTRWQALGCVAFLNVLFYALYSPKPWSSLREHMFASFMMMVNIPILFAVGVATLSSFERLKVWYRERALKRATLLAEDGPSWPWLVLSAMIVYALLCVFARRFWIPVDALQAASVQILSILLFITRDILFVQWCKLTRLRAPVLKGVLFLGLYYISSVVVAVVFSIASENSAQKIIHLLTPFDLLGPHRNGFRFDTSTFVGMGIQLTLSVALVLLISGKVSRPKYVMGVSGD